MRVINIAVLLFCVASFHQAHAQFDLLQTFLGPTTITCSQTQPNPINGVAVCENLGNFDHSECTFRCNSNSRLIGSEMSVCRNGIWSSPAPTCRPKAITCSPTHSNPTNGAVKCTNSNKLNSVCTFRCNSIFRLIGSGKSVCRNVNPTPRPVLCEYDDGDSCTSQDGTNFYKTRKAKGCPDNRVKCTKPEIGAALFQSNLLGPQAFQHGSSSSRGGGAQAPASSGRGSSLAGRNPFIPAARFAPTNTANQLLPFSNNLLGPQAFQHGSSSSRGGGAQAPASSGRGPSLAGRNPFIAAARFAPTNTANQLLPFSNNLLGPQAFQHGSSSSRGGGAQAPASSGRGPSLAGRNPFIAAARFAPTTTAAKPQKSSCTGIPDGKGGFAFGSCNKRIPLTRKKRMVSNKKRDLVLLLDESGSVGKKRFENVTRIAAAIVKLLCGDIRYHKSYTRITVISFDQQVHFHIPLNKYFPSAADLAEFIRKKIIYDSTTHGSTCLGKALEFVYDVALTRGGRRENPDTEQDVIIITDGCSNCGYKTLNADQTIDYFVKKFKGAGIHVYVIGIGLTGYQANCKDKLSVLATGGRCYHFFYLDNWDYDVGLFIQQLEKPPNGACVDVFEHPSGQCLPSGR